MAGGSLDGAASRFQRPAGASSSVAVAMAGGRPREGSSAGLLSGGGAASSAAGGRHSHLAEDAFRPILARDPPSGPAAPIAPPRGSASAAVAGGGGGALARGAQQLLARHEASPSPLETVEVTLAGGGEAV